MHCASARSVPGLWTGSRHAPARAASVGRTSRCSALKEDFRKVSIRRELPSASLFIVCILRLLFGDGGPTRGHGAWGVRRRKRSGSTSASASPSGPAAGDAGCRSGRRGGAPGGSGSGCRSRGSARVWALSGGRACSRIHGLTWSEGERVSGVRGAFRARGESGRVWGVCGSGSQGRLWAWAYQTTAPSATAAHMVHIKKHHSPTVQCTECRPGTRFTSCPSVGGGPHRAKDTADSVALGPEKAFPSMPLWCGHTFPLVVARAAARSQSYRPRQQRCPTPNCFAFGTPSNSFWSSAARMAAAPFNLKAAPHRLPELSGQ